MQVKNRQKEKAKHCFSQKQISVLKITTFYRKVMEKAQEAGVKATGSNRLHKEVTSLFLVSDWPWLPYGSYSAQSTDWGQGLAGPQDSP